MGIQGLLPFLEKATRPCHISEFRGATVVVDTYCWLHRGATTCAIQLIQGEETNLYVNYCIRYIKMLQSYDIRPILVFDGKNLPAKAGTEAKRRESRRKAKQRAAELLSKGKTEEARSYLKASLNISPEMASALIKECHKLKVDCIVAPYESDAQLAFFNLKGIAEFVITEDSDLILFGCSKVLYKLDQRGCGFLVENEKICLALNIKPDKYSFDKFRYMCILSGCDYADSLQGIGLKKAEKFIHLTDETNPEVFLDKIPRYLKMYSLDVTEEYKMNFMMADATFKHQVVFDPFKKILVHLIDPQITGTNPKYCVNAGEMYDHARAYQVALGNLHPSSQKKLNEWDPKKADLTNKSIWYDGSYNRSISWKQQKQQNSFKSFLNKSKSKLETISEVVDDIQMKLEEENRIQKELAFYSKPLPIQEIEESPVKSENIQVNEDISPILKKNPFIKRISKFQRTGTGSAVIVKSRYFPSQKEVQLSSSLKENLEGSNPENLAIIEDLTYNENLPSVPMDVDASPTDAEIDPSSADAEFEPSPPAVQFSALELVESEAKTNRVSNYFTPSQKQNSPSVNMPGHKRKLLGPCRSLGLKKIRCQGQKTISSFFQKVEKPT